MPTFRLVIEVENRKNIDRILNFLEDNFSCVAVSDHTEVTMELGFSAALVSRLRENGFTTLGSMKGMVPALKKIRGIGPSSIRQIQQVLETL